VGTANWFVTGTPLHDFNGFPISYARVKPLDAISGPVKLPITNSPLGNSQFPLK
jgi:hypothetical protein